jgi:hypothetical protein
MDEQGKVNGRFPGQDVPGHRTPAQVTIHSWHDASQHREEAAGRNRGLAVERERASPLTNYLSGPWLDRGDARRMGTRIDRRLRCGTPAIQFDDLLFSTRFPRGDFHLVEDLPLHGIVPTQPVGLAVPNVSRQIASGIRGKRQGR